jgi:hypothetical protein
MIIFRPECLHVRCSLQIRLAFHSPFQQAGKEKTRQEVNTPAGFGK